MKKVSVLPMKAFKEREAPKVDGVTYDNAPHDEFTYH
jgi:hypothetical protein